MKFLVTNDDGIFAPGVAAMVEVLQHFGEVTVVCPDQERSAISHSITLRQPVKATPVTHFGQHIRAFAVNGTPADCVKLGIEVLMDQKPDFVFSGINIGPNLGRDLYYSGTMAGASEATLHRIPAVSVSLNKLDQPINFQYPKELFYSTLEILFQRKWGPGLFLNINLPYLQKKSVKGFAVVPMDLSVSRYSYVGLNDPRGSVYYWLKDQWEQLNDFSEGSDYARLREGYITVTPIEHKRTNSRGMTKLERLFTMQTNQTGGIV
ncbi:5'/3'-nucleotidase SurE [Jeotgalibacillus sp. R-1-5s-1]|uniref:5'/3'-nucleotidase SurE n=1 Tax=Jeotgalibacillus sp. R-1-5s-1 TaxID=2555897 RepID=UPI00106BBFEF|nr:5'/3'-nucleotidase SurE [Jeotgalibacillus sp. R-1-5s-1]TFD96617.1 5'/3'-nucleotidase SurE [Jeotgalibacillus sp. R-1-5s-1]